jgi:hypothetical protein
LLDMEGRFRPEQRALEKILKVKTIGAPLYLLPGAIGF